MAHYVHSAIGLHSDEAFMVILCTDCTNELYNIVSGDAYICDVSFLKKDIFKSTSYAYEGNDNNTNFMLRCVARP